LYYKEYMADIHISCPSRDEPTARTYRLSCVPPVFDPETQELIDKLNTFAVSFAKRHQDLSRLQLLDNILDKVVLVFAAYVAKLNSNGEFTYELVRLPDGEGGIYWDYKESWHVEQVEEHAAEPADVDDDMAGWGEINISTINHNTADAVSAEETKFRDNLQEWEKAAKRNCEEAKVLRGKAGLQHVLEEKAHEGVFTVDLTARKHVNALTRLCRQKEACGIIVQVLDDSNRVWKQGAELPGNYYKWKVHFGDFPHSCSLHSQLTLLDSTYGNTPMSVEIDFEFDINLWPFYPPKVTPVWPRLTSDTLGKLLTMPELTLHKWDPMTDVVGLMVSVRNLLINEGSVYETNSPLADPTNVYSPLGLRAVEMQLWRLSMLTEVQLYMVCMCLCARVFLYERMDCGWVGRIW
jgi:hypothetical protein